MAFRTAILQLLTDLFHVHTFGPWFDEKESRTRVLTSWIGTTRDSVWYQRRECVCGRAQLRKLEPKA